MAGVTMEACIRELKIGKAKNESITARVHTFDGRSIQLHSLYNPEKEAQDWLKHIELLPNTVYIVLGFGLGYHVRALLNQLPMNSHVFVVEYSRGESLLATSRKIFKNANWLLDERMDSLVNGDVRDMAAVINKTMQEKEIKKVVVSHHYPTMQIYREYYEVIERELVEKIEALFGFDYDYRLSATDEVVNNAWNNLPNVIQSAGILTFKNLFKGKPAIMVAGGPSLDKNIELVKKYGNNAVIICAGSTMSALHYHGITPHFLVAIDPFDSMYKDLQGCMNDKSVLVAPYILSNKIIEECPGHKVFFRLGENSPNINVLSGLKDFLPPTDELKANISVAISAIDLSLYLGANPVILVGQDLAFGEDMVSHATGSKAESWLEKDKTYEEYVPVAGYYGGTVRTLPIFKEAIDYYATLFDWEKGTLFINATEGGAFLPGARHLSLQEVANEFLQNTLNPFEKIGTALTETNVINKDNKERLTLHLQENLTVLRGFLYEAERVVKETDDCPSAIKAGDIEKVKSYLAKFDDFYNRIKTADVYIHLIPAVDAIVELFNYQKQDGFSDLEEEFLTYITMFLYFKKALEKIEFLMQQALCRLEELS